MIFSRWLTLLNHNEHIIIEIFYICATNSDQWTMRLIIISVLYEHQQTSNKYVSKPVQTSVY